MENRFETFTYLVLKIGKLIQRIKTIEMEGLGLKAVHVMCIYFLDKEPNGLSSKELCQLTLEDKAAISRALNVLKGKNMINYESNKYNGLITLTDYGKEVASYIYEKSNEALNRSSIAINDEERDCLYSALKKVERNMEAYYNEIK